MRRGRKKEGEIFWGVEEAEEGCGCMRPLPSLSALGVLVSGVEGGKDEVNGGREEISQEIRQQRATQGGGLTTPSSFPLFCILDGAWKEKEERNSSSARLSLSSLLATHLTYWMVRGTLTHSHVHGCTPSTTIARTYAGRRSPLAAPPCTD